MAILRFLLAAALPIAAPAAAQEADGFLSRITLEAPVFTRHVPDDRGFNDHNWGLLAEVALDPQWSVVGGVFTNSYYRDTAILGARYSLWQWHAGGIRVDPGILAGFDLNGGYKDHNAVDPLLGALSLKVSGDGFGGASEFLNRTGLALTVIPGDNVALNLAVTLGL